MKITVPYELITIALAVVLFFTGIGVGAWQLVAGAFLVWCLITTVMLYRLFAYLRVVASSAQAMDNVNRVIDSLLVSPASRASRQAAAHAAERAKDQG
jgi:hypothetical protein